MKKALIIFTRVPEAGRTKTRLQSLLTGEECAKMHEAILGDQKELCESKEWDTFVYFTPANGRERIQQLLPCAVDYIPQEEIEFGARMRNCIRQVLERGYDACHLVGTDIPALDKTIITQAFAVLEEKDVVIGATKDQGYYLIGMKQIHQGIFEDQVYGTGTVFGDTVEKIKKCGCSYGTLPILRDVDEPEDLRAYLWEYRDKTEKIAHAWAYLVELDKKYGLEYRNEDADQ